MAKEKKHTIIEIDPNQKPPKSELDQLPSVFVDKRLMQKLIDEVAGSGHEMDKYASAHVIRGVVHLSALGIPPPVIAKSLMIPKTRVKQILGADSVKLEVERIQAQHYNRDCEQMFKRLVPSAVQTIVDIMTDGKSKESTKLDSAKYIVDRAHGKAVERTEIKTDLLADVYGRLSKPKSASQNEPIDAEFESIGPSAEPKDDLEDLLGDKK